MLPGRLTRWKGQTLLIDAIARLGRRDIVLLFVGSDQGRTAYRAELEKRVRSRGLEGSRASSTTAPTCRRPTCWPTSWFRPRPIPRRSGAWSRKRRRWAARSWHPRTGGARDPDRGQDRLDLRGEPRRQACRRAAVGAGARFGRAQVAGRDGDRACARELHQGTDVPGDARRLRGTAARDLSRGGDERRRPAAHPRHQARRAGRRRPGARAHGGDPRASPAGAYRAADGRALRRFPAREPVCGRGLGRSASAQAEFARPAGAAPPPARRRVRARLRPADLRPFRALFPPDGAGPGRAWSGIAAGCSLPHANPARDSLHTVDRQREQLASAGIADVPASSLDWVVADLARFKLPDPYVLLVPGGSAGRPAKRWPVAKFAALATELLAHGAVPVLVGGPDEKGLGETIRAVAPRARDLIGQTSFAEVAAMARGAGAAIGNDTGPMHLIAATGCPSVVLFSSGIRPQALRAARGGGRGPAPGEPERPRRGRGHAPAVRARGQGAGAGKAEPALTWRPARVNSPGFQLKKENCHRPSDPRIRARQGWPAHQ